MISQLGVRISNVFRRTAPDPFVLAILLTFLTFVLVFVLTKTPFMAAVRTWAGTDGVWSGGMLKFAMQMCLILVTGHALASSPPVSRVLSRLAGMPRTPSQAIALVAGTAAVLAVLNWGVGLIAGAIMARRVGVAMQKRGVAVHYPLLVAAGYVGLLVWHGGFSGSAPLKVTQASEIQDIFGDNAPFGPLAISQTLLSPLNLFVTGGLLILVPAVLACMNPKSVAQIEEASAFGVQEDHRPSQSASGGVHEGRAPLLPRVLEDSPLVTVALAALIAAWAVQYYFPPVDPDSGVRPDSGFLHLTPDTVNMTVLLFGLILHGSPMRYMRAIEEAARGCAGIIIQFPLYAGIMGLMAGTGLAAVMSHAMAEHATQATLPVLTLASAGVVNLFIPSGGGQWAVQGPIAMRAAAEIGVSPARIVMAVAYGDELTNMLQPFWALPLLAITGVKARDIVGYTAIVMCVAAVWMAVGLLAF